MYLGLHRDYILSESPRPLAPQVMISYKQKLNTEGRKWKLPTNTQGDIVMSFTIVSLIAGTYIHFLAFNMRIGGKAL